MKKLIITLLMVSLFLVPLTLFASGEQEGGAAKQITLRYYEHADRFNINPKINQMYMEENPNITVEFIQNPEGGADRVHDKLVTMLAAQDSSVDIFLTDVIWPPEMAAAGFLQPLDEWFTKDMQKDYVPAMIDAQTINGKVHGVPTLNDVGHMFYRKDILSDAGMEYPEYWSELVDICTSLQTDDLIGFINCYFPDQQLMCNYVEYLWGKGGQFLDSTGKQVKFTEKESVDAIQFMKDMKDKWEILQPGVTTMLLDDGRQIFTEGRAIFHRNWNYVWAMSETHEESKISGKTGVAVLPTFQGEEHHTSLGGWSYSVNPYSENLEEAVKLVLFLGGPEIQKYRAIYGDRTPAYMPMLTDPEVQEVHPVYKEWQKYADRAKSRPKSPYYTQISDIFQRQLQEALIGNKSIDAAMAEAAKEIKPIIQQ